MKNLARMLAQPRTQIALYLAGAAVASAVATAMVADAYGRRAEAEIAKRAEETLRLNAGTLLGHLEKYRHLPAMMARRADVQAVAAGDFGPEVAGAAQAILFDMNALSGGVDAAFVTRNGSVVHSATGYLEKAIAPGSPLAKAALEGRLGRAPVSGTAGRRAYAFASAIRIEGGIAGIVAIAAPLETIEQDWALSSTPILALDAEGRMVAGNLLARENEEKVRAAIGGQAPEYRAHSRDLPLLGWRLHVMEPASKVLLARSNGATVALLASALAAGVGLVLLLGRQHARRQRRHERAAAIRLERQVRHRTRDLKATNERLEVEVEERRAAEAALRKAQGDLVQSAKLAAIGQMSAALAHEYNQPLAAIRTYSDNARKFIARGNPDKAGSNLERIASLVERMATLSKTLKSFARRPRSEITPVQLDAVLRDALLLAGHKAASAGVDIRADDAPQGLMVMAGHVRLSQVLVNLLSNAVDASLATGAAEVRLQVAADGEAVEISVSDRGPGIAASDMSSIFDPFFTTKDVGEGLGLGLSIAYNIVHEFSGRLEAANRDGGGAVFRVTLPLARQAIQPSAQAAE